MKAPKTGAGGLPRPHQARQTTKEIMKAGQGPGETPMPPGVGKYVRGLTRQIKLPRKRG